MARQSVQEGYFEAPLAGFPGQLADFGTSNDNTVRGYPAEGDVIFGRGVVKGTDIDLDPDANPLNQPSPFTIKAPEAGSVAADFVGIVVRTEAGTNIDDEGGYADLTMASVMHNHGVGATIYVKTHLAVAQGDPVYMSVDAAALPNLPVGEFSNAAAAGVILLPRLRWFKSAAAGEIGIIEVII